MLTDTLGESTRLKTHTHARIHTHTHTYIHTHAGGRASEEATLILTNSVKV